MFELRIYNKQLIENRSNYIVNAVKYWLPFTIGHSFILIKRIINEGFNVIANGENEKWYIVRNGYGSEFDVPNEDNCVVPEQDGSVNTDDTYPLMNTFI